jgi:hypothetical protein
MLRQVVFILSFFLTTAAYGQQWFPLGTGLEHPFSQDTNVAVMFVDTVDNSLYVAGIFKSINERTHYKTRMRTTKHIGKW